MLDSFRALRAHLSNQAAYKASNVRFAQAVSGSNPPAEKKDQENDPQSKPGEKSSIGGGGYAKRSDEAGFGAMYRGEESLSKEDQEKIVHANVPKYDESERSSSRS